MSFLSILFPGSVCNSSIRYIEIFKSSTYEIGGMGAMGAMGGRPMGGMRGPMGMGRPGPYDRGDRYGPIGGPMGRYGGPGGYGNVKGPGGMYGYGGYGGGFKFQSYSVHFEFIIGMIC